MNMPTPATMPTIAPVPILELVVPPLVLSVDEGVAADGAEVAPEVAEAVLPVGDAVVLRSVKARP
jgi:hypothetical protein